MCVCVCISFSYIARKKAEKGIISQGICKKIEGLHVLQKFGGESSEGPLRWLMDWSISPRRKG